MQAEFQYTLSKEEYVAGLTPVMDELGRQDSSRTRRLLEQLALAVVILGAITFLFPDAGLGLLAAIVLFTVLTSLLAPRWLRAATGQSYDPDVTQLDVEISDDGIVERTGMRERRWAWAAVRRIHESSTAVALEMAGWDMLVLPHRLWDSDDQRRAFVNELRTLATSALAIREPRTAARVDTRDLLTIGAIAAAVDVLAIVTFAMPAYRGPGQPVDDGIFLGMFAGLLLLGLVLAYVAYRLARRGLDRLHDRSPGFATGIAHALVWAVPAYMVLAYLRWV
ncbi:MAG TPA: YcxB family protein [Sphingomicrobium sp.]|jgi:hypothetical protein|nr:YcxB family protein [Sphingomicrobium sp.]